MHALVTGATSGLGKAICEEFSKRGVAPIIADKTNCDVRVGIEAENLAATIYDLDVLINCAGVNWLSPLEELDEASWEYVMDTNARSIFLMTKAFLPHLKRSRGTVVVVASTASCVPMTHSLAYNASKAAAAMMVKQLARELTKPHGITVFGINPNKLEGTAMSKYISEAVPLLRGWTKEQAHQYQLNALTTGFETKPEWIAELLVWLLAEKHRHEYLSGCNLDLGA